MTNSPTTFQVVTFGDLLNEKEAASVLQAARDAGEFAGVEWFGQIQKRERENE